MAPTLNQVGTFHVTKPAGPRTVWKTRSVFPRGRSAADAAATRGMMSAAIARAHRVAAASAGARGASDSSCVIPTTSESPLSGDRRRVLRTMLAAAATAVTVTSRGVPPAFAAAATEPMPFAELEGRALAAYRGKRLDEALDLLTRIISLEPDNGTWYERRAQVLVDLKRFKPAVDDFDKAVSLYDPNFRSLGLLSNRALAYEGLSDWEGAVRDYSDAIRLSREIGGVPPYVLNSRGNALASLGRWEEALVDYNEATSVFQVMRNLSGAIYARSNAALTLAELGRDDDAIREMEAVSRRAAGSIDMRAALAAMHWSRGEEAKAESYWGWACDKINSGVLTEGGPALDGCALYRDSDWLGRIRRWPPSMVTKMDNFINLREQK